MENTITSWEPNDSFTIDQNWKNLKEFQSKFFTIERMSKPYLVTKNTTSVQAKEYAEKLEAYEKNKEDIREEQKIAAPITSKAFLAFENYIKEKSGLNDIPEQYRAKVWSYAYERGHSSGYSEVYNYLLELINIFE